MKSSRRPSTRSKKKSLHKGSAKPDHVILDLRKRPDGAMTWSPVEPEPVILDLRKRPDGAMFPWRPTKKHTSK